MVREAFIQDDGDSLQIALVQDGKQIGGAVVELDLLGVDAAYQVAMLLGHTFMSAGHGEVSSPYRPAEGSA